MKKRVPLLFMLLLCLLLVIGIVVFSAMIKNIRSADHQEIDNYIEMEDNNPEGDTTIPIGDDVFIPTPEPSGNIPEGTEHIDPGTPPETVVIMSGTDQEQGESEYKAVKSDMSWEDAQKACKLIKGHLATISSHEEFEKIVSLADSEGLKYVWIGCHRDDRGNYVWENGETINIDDLNAWGKGEPSFTDNGEKEDYIMLWFFNGKWSFNDSASDPCSEYPADYSGKMGYICEFDG